MFRLYYKHVGQSKFTAISNPITGTPYVFPTRETAIEAIVGMIPKNTTTTFQVREYRKVLWQNTPNNNPRKPETIVGSNLQRLHAMVDACHVGESYPQVCRKLLASLKISVPRPIKRGIILAAIARHKHNRAFYGRVMSGKF